MKFQLLNYELGFEGGGRLLTGWSGQTYGQPSRWHAGFAAQACELDVKDERDYLFILRDIAAAWHLPLRRWLPVPDFAAPAAPVSETSPAPPAPIAAGASTRPKGKVSASKPIAITHA